MSDSSTKLPSIPLGDLCSYQNGGTPSKKTKEYWGGKIPWITSTEIQDGGVADARTTITVEGQQNSAATQVDQGTVLLVTRTGVGKVARAPYPLAFSQDITAIVPKNGRIDRQYLFRFLETQRHYFERFSRGATIKGVTRDTLNRLEIPLPKLEEQKRIAAILDKADAIRRQRQEAIGELESLEDSAFAFTVGTRAKDYDSWSEVTIESLAASHKGAMRTGPFGSSLLHSEFVDEGIAVLGIDNAVQNRFAWDQRRFITPAKYEEMKRYTVFPNDVIITIMGTVGRSAVIPEDIPTAITTKHIATLTLDTTIAEPEFVSQAMHRHPFIAMQMTNRGAIMNSWNLGLIKSLKVPLPPIEVQREFTKHVRQLRVLREKLESGVTEADHLFNSLVQRAFKGEL